jgi:putative MATE family efflux protein
MSSIRNAKYDLTRGGILNKLLAIALPLIGTQFIQMSYNLTDMFLLGRVGSDAVAASGTAGMYLWLSNGFLMIGRMGAEIGVSQNVGRGDMRSARKYSQNSLFLACLSGIFFAVACIFFSKYLIGFFQIKETNVVLDAQYYLQITALAIPATFISGSIAGTFNGAGNSKVPFRINAIGLGINILLDPLFIFGLEMGVAGAAIATLIAQTIVCVLSVYALIKRKDRPFEKYIFMMKPEKKRVVQILKWTLPIGIENILFTFLSMFISRFVAFYGAGAIAVYRVGNQIESLSWLICIGFSTAITSFMGQNYGAGKWNRIKNGSKVALGLLFVWGIIVTFVMAVFGESLFRLFLSEPDLVVMGKVYVRLLATCQVFASLEAVASGLFRGLGKTMPPFIVSTATNVLRVILAYELSQRGFGITGIWIAITLGAIIRGIWLYIWHMRRLRNIPICDCD